MSRELWAVELKEALELAENFHDGTDYNFDRLTPDEQEVIVDAARRLSDFDAIWDRYVVATSGRGPMHFHLRVSELKQVVLGGTDT